MISLIYQVIIIGSGPAGLTAGIYAGRAKLNPLIIEGKKPGGQLMGTSYIENWPGEKKILGFKLIEKIKKHAQKSGCSFLSDSISNVDFSHKPFKLWTETGKMLQADSIIIATGASSRKLKIPGEDLYWGKGISTCAICDGFFYQGKKTVVIGGGDSAAEMASYLTKFTNQITIIQNLDQLTASKAMKERVLNNSNIKIIYNSEIKKIDGDGKTIKGIEILNKKDNKKIYLKTDGVFLAIGLIPNSLPFKGQIDLDKYGYIKIKDYTKTSVNGIFAAGDVVDYVYRQAITSAGMGCMAALDVEKYLKGTA